MPDKKREQPAHFSANPNFESLSRVYHPDT
jgi:hypothetical protein